MTMTPGRRSNGQKIMVAFKDRPGLLFQPGPGPGSAKSAGTGILPGPGLGLKIFLNFPKFS